MPRAIFHVDPVLTQETQPLIDNILRGLEAHDALRKDVADIRDKSDRCVTQINRLLGLTPDAEQRAEQQRLFEEFAGLHRLWFAPAGELTLTIAPLDRAKAHLRAGGLLPLTTFDASTNTATINLDLKQDESGRMEQAKELVVIVKPGVPIEDAADAWFEIDDALRNEFELGIAVHEITELALIKSFAGRRVDPHWRWYSDGLANTVTLLVLEDIGEPAQAEAIRHANDIQHFAVWAEELNLRYWLEGRFEPQIKAYGEDDLRLARYAFALHEIQKLIDHHGTDWIAHVVADLEANDKPGSATIIAAIHQHTGVDMDSRLDRYQSFTARNEGISKYAEVYGQAMDAGDHAAALRAALRLTELQFTGLNPKTAQASYDAVYRQLVDLEEPALAEALQEQLTIRKAVPSSD